MLPRFSRASLMGRSRMFEIMTRLVTDFGIEAAREFALGVNRHLEALTEWQARMDIVAREKALRGTPEPARADCDSEAAFQSAHRCWQDAQTLAHFPYPAPVAPMFVEQAIEVHTAADGRRTYKYSNVRGDCVQSDALIRLSRGEV
jgi:hypothetical protein